MWLCVKGVRFSELDFVKYGLDGGDLLMIRGQSLCTYEFIIDFDTVFDAIQLPQSVKANINIVRPLSERDGKNVPADSMASGRASVAITLSSF